MERLTLLWFILFGVIALTSSAAAQSTFPAGAVVGIVFGILGVCLGVGIPICIWVCIFCGAFYASKQQSQRTVNSVVVTPGSGPHPPPGSYPTQSQAGSTTAYSAYPSTDSAYPVNPAYPAQPPATNPAYPAQPPATNPAYPVQQPLDPSYPVQQQSTPYPAASGYGYPDAPPPYAPPSDNKTPL